MLGDTFATESDEELMRRYLSGETRAFEVVYRRRRDGVRRFFAKNCRSDAVAEELAQEVWFKLIRACQNRLYTAEAKFTTFLYRLAHNQLIDWYRSRRDVRFIELNEAVQANEDGGHFVDLHQEDGETVLLLKQRREHLADAIAKLSAEQRATLLMQVEGNMSYDDIARAMHTNRETVKTRLRYARGHLKRHLLALDFGSEALSDRG